MPMKKEQKGKMKNIKHKDLWNILATCAEDWGFVSTGAGQGTGQNTTQGAHMSQKETLSTPIIPDSLMHDESVRPFNRQLIGKTPLVHDANFQNQDEYVTMAKQILSASTANTWQLNFEEYHHFFNEHLHNESVTGKNSLIMDEIVTWFATGIKKGWLQPSYEALQSILPHFEKQTGAHLMHRNCLTQERLWSKLESTCTKHQGRLSIVLFHIPQTKGNDKIYDKEYLELAEQIHTVLRTQDFFGEVSNSMISLVLPDCGVFGATACAERIMSKMTKMLHVQGLLCPFEVGVAERMDGENIDILFAHAKEALSLPLQNDASVHVYRALRTEKKHDSLVQATEKQFLFFGIQ